MLCIIALLLVSCVIFTFTLKRDMFGETPFFFSLGLFTRELALNIGYTAQFAGKTAAQYATAILGVSEFPHGQPIEAGPALSVPILNYHRVAAGADDGVTMAPDVFAEQMEALKRAGWHTVALRDFEAFIRGEKELPQRSVLITFDDGSKASYYPVDPVLRALGFNAVAFIIAGDSESPGSTYYLSSAEIRRMIDSGRWEIGSHSWSGHHSYTIDETGLQGHFFSDRLWIEELGRLETPAEFRARVREDLSRSRATLENTYGVIVDSFAFPFGDSGESSINFPSAHDVVEAEAKKIYSFGFLQLGKDGYSFNYPSSDFIVRRITAKPDWSGEELLALLESGIAKELPYNDDSITESSGWNMTWGDGLLENGRLEISAVPNTTSASAILDGTKQWNNYAATARTFWQSGYFLVLADVENGRTYRACSFSPGGVRIQDVREGERYILTEAAAPSVQYGSDVRPGIEVIGTTIACTWNGDPVLTFDTGEDRTGGVGIQAWNETPGAARAALTGFSATALP